MSNPSDEELMQAALDAYRESVGPNANSDDMVNLIHIVTDELNQNDDK